MLSPEKFASEINVHPQTVRRWIQSGVIRGVKVGGVWRIPPEELRRIMDAEPKA